MRRKYYINMQSRKISEDNIQNEFPFAIYATDEEVGRLQRKFNEIYDAELSTYWRAHVPFIPYHKDGSNDQYDSLYTDVLEMIYNLGDEQTKQYIDQSGVLMDYSLDTERTLKNKEDS